MKLTIKLDIDDDRAERLLASLERLLAKLNAPDELTGCIEDQGEPPFYTNDE